MHIIDSKVFVEKDVLMNNIQHAPNWDIQFAGHIKRQFIIIPIGQVSS